MSKAPVMVKGSGGGAVEYKYKDFSFSYGSSGTSASTSVNLTSVPNWQKLSMANIGMVSAQSRTYAHNVLTRLSMSYNAGNGVLSITAAYVAYDTGAAVSVQWGEGRGTIRVTYFDE